MFALEVEPFMEIVNKLHLEDKSGDRVMFCKRIIMLFYCNSMSNNLKFNNFTKKLS